MSLAGFPCGCIRDGLAHWPTMFLLAFCHPERSGWFAKRSSHGVEGALTHLQ
jgi:hypothetical protein